MPIFEIDVTRVGVGFATISVEARDRQEAEEKALDEAGDHSFSEKGSEYELTHGTQAAQSEETRGMTGGLVPLPKLPASIYRHERLGDLFDALAMHKYAVAYAQACGVPMRVRPEDEQEQPSPPGFAPRPGA